jgi:hypothetical protein
MAEEIFQEICGQNVPQLPKVIIKPQVQVVSSACCEAVAEDGASSSSLGLPPSHCLWALLVSSAWSLLWAASWDGAESDCSQGLDQWSSLLIAQKLHCLFWPSLEIKQHKEVTSLLGWWGRVKLHLLMGRWQGSRWACGMEDVGATFEKHNLLHTS